jgi:hypothetical protein
MCIKYIFLISLRHNKDQEATPDSPNLNNADDAADVDNAAHAAVMDAPLSDNDHQQAFHDEDMDEKNSRNSPASDAGQQHLDGLDENINDGEQFTPSVSINLALTGDRSYTRRHQDRISSPQ